MKMEVYPSPLSPKNRFGFPQSDSDWEDLFEEKARNPVHWAIAASRLKRAAENILNVSNEGFQEMDEARKIGTLKKLDTLSKVEIQPIWLLLAGFSLENLLKGLCIHLDPSRINKRKKMNWPGDGHDLLKLVNLANQFLKKEQRIKLSEEETRFLKIAGKHARWVGRYPTALGSQEFTEDSKSGLGQWVSYHPTHRELTIFNQFFERVSTVYVPVSK